MLSEILQDFVHLCFPNCCACCGRSLMKGEDTLCLHCECDLPPVQFFKDEDNPVAKLFWGKIDVVNATATYAFRQRGMMQRLLHAMKYQGRSDVAEKAGRIMAQKVKTHLALQDVTRVVPVPLHQRKLKQRGYNQSEFIGRGLTSIWEKKMVTDNLYRHKFSNTQTKKNRLERWDNVNNIFKLKRPEDFIGEHVLILDDVVTTGSTLEACATAIMQVPQVKVSVLALAYPTYD